jgi:hypothetical protein
MTFEEFEKATPKQLRDFAKARFETANTVGSAHAGTPALLLEAQFYLAEIDRREANKNRREDRRVSLRDLLLEIVVIVLIGVEIMLAVRQGVDEDLLMAKQNAILTNLQTASSATADALKAQLELFYDVSVNFFYVPAQKMFRITNNGRTNITLEGSKFGTDATTMNATPLVVVPTGSWDFKAQPWSDTMRPRVAKGSSQAVPLLIYLKNEKKDEFTLHIMLTFEWNNDDFTVRVAINSITPHWQM